MALTADLQDYIVGPIMTNPRVPVAANAVMFAGSIVGWNASGYLDTADNAAAGKALGIATCALDNTGGANGALRNHIITRGMVDLAAGALTQANVGSPVYATDDNTLTATSNNKLLGTMVDFLDGTTARIQIG